MPFGFNFLHRLLGDVHTPHYFNEVALVGNAADKPTGANAKDNMLFYEQDTGLWKRYRSALSEWVLVAPNMQLVGYDYEALVSKNLALDPETKALKIKSQIVEGGNEGVTTFLELTDVFPSSYLGQALKGVRVRSGEDGLEFAAVNGGAFDNYKCRAYLGSDQSINIDASTKINLSATSYDPYDCFDSVNHRIVIKKPGDYLIIGQVWYDWNIYDGCVCELQIKKNGAYFMFNDDMAADGATKDVQPHSADVHPLALNDYLELWTRYYKGDAKATIQADVSQNYLTVIRMR